MVRVQGDGSASKNVSDASLKTRVLSLKSTVEGWVSKSSELILHHNSLTPISQSHTHTQLKLLNDG